MADHSLQSAQPPAVGGSLRVRSAPIIFGISLLIIWGILIARFRGEWSGNPEYSYGWSVPVLCLYLAYQRWRAVGESVSRSVGESAPRPGISAFCFLLSA